MDGFFKVIHYDTPSLNYRLIAILESLMVEATQILHQNDLYFHFMTTNIFFQ
jgi:hypothetical protein